MNSSFLIQRSQLFFLSTSDKCIVARCLKTGIMESDRQLISWTTASIASQRPAIPSQRLGKQLLSLQRMLTKGIPVTTRITEENEPFGKVSPNRYAKNLLQDEEHFRHTQITDAEESSSQIRRSNQSSKE
jgi:hypothetical protein